MCWPWLQRITRGGEIHHAASAVITVHVSKLDVFCICSYNTRTNNRSPPLSRVFANPAMDLAVTTLNNDTRYKTNIILVSFSIKQTPAMPQSMSAASFSQNMLVRLHSSLSIQIFGSVSSYR